jgi:tRNA (guanosine-2'-O-)-methyltransferase
MTDRRKLAACQAPKTSKLPRTDRRVNRIEEVIDRRQPDLTVVLENVHDPHNASAVLRSCDAVGIQRVALVYTVESPPTTFARSTSASAAKWIDVERFDSIEDCYATLRARGFSIYAAALSEESKDLFDIDFTSPAAVVFGNEMRGLSEEAIARADATVQIPMVGMVRSIQAATGIRNVRLAETARGRANEAD